MTALIMQAQKSGSDWHEVAVKPFFFAFALAAGLVLLSYLKDIVRGIARLFGWCAPHGRRQLKDRDVTFQEALSSKVRAQKRWHSSKSVVCVQKPWLRNKRVATSVTRRASDLHLRRVSTLNLRETCSKCYERRVPSKVRSR